MGSSDCSSSSLGMDAATSREFVEAIQNPDNVLLQGIQEQYFDIEEQLKSAVDSVGQGNYSTDQLMLHVSDIDNLFHKVRRADETRLDSNVLHQISILGKANIEKTQSSFLLFKPAEYADFLEGFINKGEALSEIFEADSASLNSLSKAMSYLYRSTYGLEPLYGALEWEPPERPPRAPQNRKEDPRRIVTKKTIEKVVDSATYEENQMEEVERIHKVLERRYHENQREPIAFLEFVIDPMCFSTTVQNIFHLSFLIRDKHVEFTFDKYKIPYVSPVKSKNKSLKNAGGTDTNRQSVIEMNMELWKETIRILNIEEPMIPNVSRNNKRTR